MKANMHRRETHRYMNTFIYDDPFASIRAIASQSEGEMLKHLDIYHDPNTRFQVSTWSGLSGECSLIPLALAVEVSGYCRDVLSKLAMA